MTTRYEKALREYNGYTHGTLKPPKGTKKGMMLASQKIGGCGCGLRWWTHYVTHLISERHIACKYGIPQTTLRMLIRLSDRGHTRLAEFCQHIDTYENLTGYPLTEARAVQLISQLEGDTNE